MEKYKISNTTGKTGWIRTMAAGILVCAATAGCVKDTLHDSPHPQHGRITLTTVWGDLDEGIPMPERYTVRIGDYTADLSGATNELDHLFAPDSYTIHAYNTPEGITVSGTTAIVDADASTRAEEADTRAESEHVISGHPEWFFTHMQQVDIEKDRVYRLEAPMHRQIGLLTLVMTPEGNAADRIESIEGHLEGAAGSLDFASGEYGSPSSVNLHFVKIESGRDAGKWAVSVRLLGTAGPLQRLKATIRFAGGNPEPVTIDSDMTAELDDFNDTKTIPLTLSAAIAEIPAEGEFTGVITGWQEIDNGEIEIH